MFCQAPCSSLQCLGNAWASLLFFFFQPIVANELFASTVIVTTDIHSSQSTAKRPENQGLSCPSQLPSLSAATWLAARSRGILATRLARDKASHHPFFPSPPSILGLILGLDCQLPCFPLTCTLASARHARTPRPWLSTSTGLPLSPILQEPRTC